MKLLVLGALTTTTSATTVPLDALRSVQNIENDKNKNFDYLMNFAKENKKITLNEDEINLLKNNSDFKIWVNKRNKYIGADFPIYINELIKISSLSINQRQFIIQNINGKILIKTTQKINSRKKRANSMSIEEMERILAEGPSSGSYNDDGLSIVPIKTSSPKFRSVPAKPKKSKVRPTGFSRSNSNIRYVSAEHAKVMSDGITRTSSTDVASKHFDFDSLTHDETEKIYSRPYGSKSKINEFKINGKSIGLSGITKQINKHHDSFNALINMFDGDDGNDVTIFNWNNQHILELAMNSINKNKTIQNVIKQLRHINTFKELTSWAVDMALRGGALKFKQALKSTGVFKNLFLKSKFFKFLVPTVISSGIRIASKISFTKKITVSYEERKKAILEKMKTRYKAIIPEEDINNKSLVPTIGKSALTTAIYGTLTAASLGLGPAGFVIAASISLLQHVMPTANGYSPMSNFGDRGLSEWKFQMEKNFNNMVAIAASFSEEFTHGISWRVKTNVLGGIPTMWIRPGQSSNEPWILLSKEYLVDGIKMPKKSFVYGKKIEKQSFKSITASRKKFNAQKVNGEQIWEELFETYTNEKTLGDYSKFRINTPEGVEWSGSNRYYDISWYYAKQTRWIWWWKTTLIPFEPNMNVHENDNDDNDDVKNENFKSSITHGYEIHPNEKFGHIIVKFEHEGDRQFSVSDEWNSLLRESYANVKKWAKNVIGGDNPIKDGKRVDLSKLRNVPLLKIVPRIFLHGLDIDITKFNTHNDPGWDDTHSSKFRHAGIHISFKVILEVRYIG